MFRSAIESENDTLFDWVLEMFGDPKLQRLCYNSPSVKKPKENTMQHLFDFARLNKKYSSVIKLIESGYHSTPIFRTCLHDAVVNGNILLLETIAEKPHCYCSSLQNSDESSPACCGYCLVVNTIGEIVDKIIKNDNLDVLKWIYNFVPEKVETQISGNLSIYLNWMLINDSPYILNWLYITKLIDHSCWTSTHIKDTYLLSNGLNILQWAHKMGFDIGFGGLSADWLINNPHTNIARFPIVQMNEIIDYLIWSGGTIILEWLCETVGLDRVLPMIKENDVYESGVIRGHLQIIQWAKKWNIVADDFCTVALFCGKLKILKWCIVEGCDFSHIFEVKINENNGKTIKWVKKNKLILLQLKSIMDERSKSGYSLTLSARADTPASNRITSPETGTPPDDAFASSSGAVLSYLPVADGRPRPTGSRQSAQADFV